MIDVSSKSAFLCSKLSPKGAPVNCGCYCGFIVTGGSGHLIKRKWEHFLEGWLPYLPRITVFMSFDLDWRLLIDRD